MILAFRADALDEGVLDVVDAGVVERRVVDQDLNGVGAPIDNALYGNVRQQIRQAAGLRVVVADSLISQQQARIRRRAPWRRPGHIRDRAGSPRRAESESA